MEDGLRDVPPTELFSLHCHNLALATITSHLTNCNSFLTGLFILIQSILHAAARVIFAQCKFGFVPGLLRNWLWLPIAHGIKFASLAYLHLHWLSFCLCPQPQLSLLSCFPGLHFLKACSYLSLCTWIHCFFFFSCQPKHLFPHLHNFQFVWLRDSQT